MSREITYRIKIVPMNELDAEGVWKDIELPSPPPAFTWDELNKAMRGHVPLGYTIVEYERTDHTRREPPQ
ncbi:MAG: hypothetical protein V3S55_15175 [Nitrospiraceae bacterium]